MEQAQTRQRVIIYTVAGCPFCKRTKELLTLEGIKYAEKEINHNERFAEELVQLTGHALTPVTLIAGETIIGFDKPKLTAAITKLKQS